MSYNLPILISKNNELRLEMPKGIRVIIPNETIILSEPNEKGVRLVSVMLKVNTKDFKNIESYIKSNKSDTNVNPVKGKNILQKIFRL